MLKDGACNSLNKSRGNTKTINESILVTRSNCVLKQDIAVVQNVFKTHH